MDSDRFKGQWKQLKGKVKSRWGELTDDDITAAEGDGERLAGKVQERYGISKEEADKQVKAFRDSL